MQGKSTIQQGWDFAAHLAGENAATGASATYVAQVDNSIEKLAKNINSLKNNKGYAQLGGDLAEQWHADTFNIDAIAAGSANRAERLGSTAKNSVDVRLTSGNSVKDYSLKYFATGEKSAIAQAEFSSEIGGSRYHGQERLIASDQMAEATTKLNREAARNAETRPEVAAAYKETRKHLTDRISDGEGVESIPLSKENSIKMAHRVKNDEFDPEEFGVRLNSAIKSKHIVKQAIKSGYTAAAITVAIQMAPEVYKSIDYLIKTGEIDPQHLISIGEKVITAGADGFLRGSVSCWLLIKCRQGIFGETLKNVSPEILGSTVAIVIETLKNSILVAAGKMTTREMGAAFTDSIVISTGYIAGAKIGGLVGQALGFELPILGYMIGSLVGCAFSVVYNIGKKKLISFCVDTGFTCFGLVDQNYELPEKALKELGIDTIPIHKTQISHTNINTTPVHKVQVHQTIFETIDITILRRGVIGVNKIGYII